MKPNFGRKDALTDIVHAPPKAPVPTQPVPTGSVVAPDGAVVTLGVDNGQNDK